MNNIFESITCNLVLLCIVCYNCQKAILNKVVRCCDIYIATSSVAGRPLICTASCDIEYYSTPAIFLTPNTKTNLVYECFKFFKN